MSIEFDLLLETEFLVRAQEVRAAHVRTRLLPESRDVLRRKKNDLSRLKSAPVPSPVFRADGTSMYTDFATILVIVGLFGVALFAGSGFMNRLAGFWVVASLVSVVPGRILVRKVIQKHSCRKRMRAKMLELAADIQAEKETIVDLRLELQTIEDDIAALKSRGLHASGLDMKCTAWLER